MWLCLLDIHLYPPFLSPPKVGLRFLDLCRTLLVWNAGLSTLCNDTGASNFVNHSSHIQYSVDSYCYNTPHVGSLLQLDKIQLRVVY